MKKSPTPTRKDFSQRALSVAEQATGVKLAATKPSTKPAKPRRKAG